MRSVVFKEETFQVDRSDGGPAVLRINGRPVTRFDPGWSPVGLHDGFDAILLLELRHVEGAEATWFLDDDLNYLCNRPQQLDQARLDRLIDASLDAVAVLHRALLSAASPGASDHRGFASLNLSTRRALLGLCRSRLPQPLLVLMEPAAAAGGRLDIHLSDPVSVADRTRVLSLDRSAMHAILDRDLQLDHLDLVREGHYTVPGVVSARPVQSNASIVVVYKFTAYRFVDILPRPDRSPGDNGLVFFLCTTEGIHEKEIFIPALNCTITRRDSGQAANRLPELLDEFMRNEALIRDYLPARKRTVDVPTPYPGLHLGHTLWNELSGLDRIRRGVAPDRLPLVCIQNAGQGTEVYGPIEEILPDYAGRVQHMPYLGPDLAAYVYSNRLTLIKAADDHVSRRLADAIGRASVEAARARGDLAHADDLARDGRVFVLLGLRVHSRSAPDQLDMFTDIIRMLETRLGPLVVVVDGSNARVSGDPSTDYGAFGPNGARPAMLDELEIVIQLRERFLRTCTTIVGTVGTPVLSSIFWASRCQFFVGLWGAGFAKYRWVCNLPGLVLTNRHNLDHPDGDLGIYHLPRYMETPSTLRFIDASLVTDEPGMGGFYANFRVDRPGLDQALASLIEELRPEWT